MKQKCIALFLLAAMLLTLTACGPTLSPAPEEQTPAADAAGTTTEPAQSLTLPILDEIDQNVTPGVSGSSLRAVQSAAELLDWGVTTSLDPEEITATAAAWLAEKTDDQREAFTQKLMIVDNAYQQLLTDGARDLLDTAGCEDTQITWGSETVETVEAVLRAAGLRDGSSETEGK